MIMVFIVVDVIVLLFISVALKNENVMEEQRNSATRRSYQKQNQGFQNSVKCVEIASTKLHRNYVGFEFPESSPNTLNEFPDSYYIDQNNKVRSKQCVVGD